MQPPIAKLVPESPFHKVFPEGAPILSTIPVKAQLNGEGEKDIYLLDLKRCKPDQLESVAEILSDLFNARFVDVFEEIKKHGCPIRALQVAEVEGTDAIDMRHLI